MPINNEVTKLLEKTCLPNPVSEEHEEVSSEYINKRHNLLDLDFRTEELESRKQDREERRTFAKKIFQVVVFYLAVVLVIVLLNGFRLTCIGNTVMVTLLGTSTANVIALLVIVVKYLFHSKD